MLELWDTENALKEIICNSGTKPRVRDWVKVDANDGVHDFPSATMAEISTIILVYITIDSENVTLYNV